MTSSAGDFIYSDKSLYYEQAASFSFWMMNRRGRQGRTAMIEFMADYYGRTIDNGGFRRLGFKSEHEASALFKEFLAEVQRK